MKKTALITTTLAITLLSSAAISAPSIGVGDKYIGLNIGGLFAAESDSTATFNNGASTADANVEFETNVAVDLVIGGYIANNIALEFEVGYKNTVVDSATINGVAVTTEGNDDPLYSAMVNLLYHAHNNSSVTPYFGGGVGGFMEGADNNLAFGYQAIAGLQYHINPRASMQLGYKYFETMDFENDFNNPALGGDATEEFDAAGHIISLGLRTKF